MDKTWRKLYAKTLDNEVVRAFGGPAIAFLSWMLMSADQDGRVAFSSRDLANALRFPRQTVRSVITAFQNEGTIVVEANQKRTVATLANWQKYQSSNPRVTHNQPTSNPHNTNNYNELNVKSTHNQPTSNPQVTHSTQEPVIPPRTPLLDKYNTPSPLPPSGISGTGPRGRGTGKQYPESPEEIVKTARESGYALSREAASEWLMMKRKTDWLDSSGDAIVSWPRMLVGYCQSQGCATVAQEEASEAERARIYRETHERSMEIIRKYGG